MLKQTFCNTDMIYLDNASTTIPYNCEVPDDIWYNNSAAYIKYIQEDYLTQCKESIKHIFNIPQEGDVIFTSGATESNNLVIQSVIKRLNEITSTTVKKRVLISPIEHPSVFNVFKDLEEKGIIEIDYFDVNEHGQVMTDTIDEKIYANTYFCSCMYVNNEIGTIQPIDIIGKKCRDNNILFHVDATQAIGKIPIDCLKNYIDFLTFSAHKFHGPKGIGAIILKNKNDLLYPLFFGGHQQNGKRAGTEDLQNIYIMTELLKYFCHESEINNSQITSFLCHRAIKKWLEQCFNSDEYIINSIDEIIPIINISFKNITGEYLVEQLAKQKIYISSGSACTTGLLEPSRILKAMKVNDDFIEGTIRISIDTNDIQTTIFEEIIKKIKKIISE